MPPQVYTRPSSVRHAEWLRPHATYLQGPARDQARWIRHDAGVGSKLSPHKLLPEYTNQGRLSHRHRLGVDDIPLIGELRRGGRETVGADL